MNAPKLRPRQPTQIRRERRDVTLTEYCRLYFASRDVTPDYETLFLCRIGVFVKWYGSDPKIAELTCDVANEWLTALLGAALSPVTVAGYSRCLRAVWFYAYQAGDNDDPPFRLKKIRQPQRRIEAFTHEQLAKLLTAAESLKGYFPNGVKRSTFWQAAIHAAYSTGLRRGDLLRVKREEIAADGTYVALQSKTGYRVCVRFSVEAMEKIGRMHAEDDDDRALPWPFHENSLSIQFREVILKAAGIARGSLKWLRRSAGSYAEADQPGTGSRMLGHRSLSVFHNYYDDQTISVSQPISPPPIERPDHPRKEVV